MNPEEYLEQALSSPQAGQVLRARVLELSQTGRTKPEIYGILERILVRMRARNGLQASAEEALLDVMDGLTDWCHRDARLLTE